MVEWTVDVEEMLVCLWQSNPCLYDPDDKAYGNRYSKNRALLEISDRLEISLVEITRRITTLRTQFNRLYRRPQDYLRGKKKTPRQEWLMRRLAFLLCTKDRTINPMSTSQTDIDGSEEDSKEWNTKLEPYDDDQNDGDNQDDNDRDDYETVEHQSGSDVGDNATTEEPSPLYPEVANTVRPSLLYPSVASMVQPNLLYSEGSSIEQPRLYPETSTPQQTLAGFNKSLPSFRKRAAKHARTSETEYEIDNSFMKYVSDSLQQTEQKKSVYELYGLSLAARLEALDSKRTRFELMAKMDNLINNALMEQERGTSPS